MKINWKTVGIHSGIILGFIIVAVAYFYPVLQDKIIYQGDIVQYIGMADDRKAHVENHDEEPYWIDNAFGGMPSYQVGANYPHHYIKSFDRFLRFLPRPVDYLFLYFVGLYILLLVMRVKPLIAFFGALAFGFSTYLIIILGVGHNAKAHAIAYMPMVIAGVLLCLRHKYILGFITLALGMALEIAANHFQMTYYLTLLCVVIGVVYLIEAIKHKALLKFSKAVGLAFAAAILGLSLNATNLLATQEYTQYSTRGETTVSITPNGQPKSEQSALEYDYITEYSYGIAETFNWLMPRFMGGSNAESLSSDSETYEELLSMGASPSQAKGFLENVPLYWGDQTYVAAPAYIGAGVLALFVLALFLVRSKFKTWIVVGSILALLLSWGDNFSVLTQLFIDYVPLYDKFRAVSSIQVLIELCVPLMAFVGLAYFFSEKTSKETRLKALKMSGIITGGLLVFFMLFKTVLFDFSGGSDSYFMQQYGAGFVRALKLDRQAVFMADAWRSLFIVVIILGILWFWLQQKLKMQWAILIIGVICVLDLVLVDKRYVNEEDFVSKIQMKKPFQANSADQEILKDKSHFRVLDLSESPFNSARASYFHKSFGGYHAAKPQRIQDIFDFHIAKGNREVLNMFNVKYNIIENQGELIAQPNPDANGNAWFVDSLKVVKDDNAAILALNDIDTKTTAIIKQKFTSEIEQQQLQIESLATIELIDYKMNHLVYESQNQNKGFAVFSEMYYPKGWQAFIDGEPVNHIQVDYTLRGLSIPKGKHQIEFKFEPQVIKTGSRLSLAGHILFILVLAFGVFKFSKRSSTQVKDD
ncbi:YfhO family protein [Mesohalobacter halotolerans]|uniref:YfhO family protein n=1 Tax=Mesohalobacter halotolerans TaxID=1883405 RepID=A0A4U5TNW5_9FLAO|nr:YfhO family protein [Mesohalobacter halotolerans]TKS55730.1 YfhO family protein [Mesohalobacter halotolerans]